MSIKEYNIAIQLLKQHEIVPLDLPRPSRELITRLESRLGVHLPNSYSKCLEDFGVFIADSLELAGLGLKGLDGTDFTSVAFATESLRSRNIITNTMVYLSATGYGPIIVLDCNEKTFENEAPVYEISGNGINFGKENIADSFGLYFLEEVNKLIGFVEDDGAETGINQAQYWSDRSRDFE